MTPELLKQAREALQNAAQELHHIDAGPIKELGGVIAKVEDAAAALSPVVISEMETPTPETDAAEAMVEQANFENTGKGQERSRKEAAWEYARSLETRLAAAEAELAAMRSGEVVAWMDASDPERPQTIPAWARDAHAFGRVVEGAYTIPLYRSPAPVVVEPRVWTATEAAEGPVFDRDGYPTDRTLELITTWPYDRFPELWAYLREAWNYTYGAMSEGAVEGGGSEVVLITGGWSGNESIVSSLASNLMFRAIFWYQDTRGGRHVYRIPTHPMKEGE